MRSTGIVRKVDQLGRIVLAKELRDTRSIQEGTPLEIFVEGETIILKKYQPGCVFCDSLDKITFHKGKPICKKCLEELSNE